MKYDNYNSNQRFVTIDFKLLTFSNEKITLKIEHAALFEYIAQFIFKGNAKTRIIYNKPYYEITTRQILHDMPGLNITTPQYLHAKYIKDLCLCGLLEKFVDIENGNQVFYHITKLAYNKLLKTNKQYKNCKLSYFQTIGINKKNNNN